MITRLQARYKYNVERHEELIKQKLVRRKRRWPWTFTNHPYRYVEVHYIYRVTLRRRRRYTRKCSYKWRTYLRIEKHNVEYLLRDLKELEQLTKLAWGLAHEDNGGTEEVHQRNDLIGECQGNYQCDGTDTVDSSTGFD